MCVQAEAFKAVDHGHSVDGKGREERERDRMGAGHERLGAQPSAVSSNKMRAPEGI